MTWTFAIWLVLVPANDGKFYWQFDHAEKISKETCNTRKENVKMPYQIVCISSDNQ